MTHLRILIVLAIVGAWHVPMSAFAQDGDRERQDRRMRQPDRERGMGQGRNGMGPGSGNDPFTRNRNMKAGESLQGWDGLMVHEQDGKAIAVDSLVPEDGTLVVVNGCLTCPKFLRSYAGMEALARDHAGNDKIHFVYLYKTLAHPENDSFVQAFALPERLAQMAEAEQRLKTSIPFVCDGMDNAALQAFGGSPNSQVVVDGDGRILHCAGWADADVLRKALVDIVGETETTTSVDDLDLPRFRGVTRPAGNIVPRVRPTEPLSALRMEPKASKETYFVKLRAEASQAAVSGDSGELYLGFHLDPIHHVHWNNLVDPIVFEVTAPEGVEVTPATATGPKVDAATDSDPREFLSKVTGWNGQGPLEVKVAYYACSDGNGDESKAFCRKVEQVYLVYPERDRSAGFVQARTGNRSRGGRGERGGGGAGEMLARLDRNQDGKLTLEEVRGSPLESRFERMDQDGDGVLGTEELQRMQQRMRGRGGSGDRRRNRDFDV
ncbi:MAG: EF-hand domain-containing protein [Phycisphaerales bacterium]|nr:EF-hand domain-containing protein [Phycisphaerales bacterium]